MKKIGSLDKHQNTSASTPSFLFLHIPAGKGTSLCQLKGNPTEDASWPENEENVQIFSFEGFKHIKSSKELYLLGR